MSMVGGSAMKLIMYTVVAAMAVSYSACGGDGADSDRTDGTIKAVATIGMIADIVENVGGENVHVDGLMGPGIDPHLYKASAGDVALMSGADMIFYNGLHLEAKMADIFERMSGRVRTVAVAGGLPDEELLSSATYAGQHDPHVWFDVLMWKNAVAAARDALIDMDAAGADGYRTRADQYLSRLDSLHAYVQVEAAKVPEVQRVIITSHDAFRYLGRAYGFEVRGLQGISTASEAGAADVQNLAAFIVERRIPAIFVESSVSGRSIEAVQAAARAQGWEVVIGGELYSDAMGNPDTPEGTYPGMVRHNIDTIVAALSGSAASAESEHQ